jgi:hypothetical protein
MRNRNGVEHKNRYLRWTDDEKALLKELAHLTPIELMNVFPERDHISIKNMRYNLSRKPLRKRMKRSLSVAASLRGMPVMERLRIEFHKLPVDTDNRYKPTMPWEMDVPDMIDFDIYSMRLGFEIGRLGV